MANSRKWALQLRNIVPLRRSGDIAGRQLSIGDRMNIINDCELNKVAYPLSLVGSKSGNIVLSSIYIAVFCCRAMIGIHVARQNETMRKFIKSLL